MKLERMKLDSMKPMNASIDDSFAAELHEISKLKKVNGGNYSMELLSKRVNILRNEKGLTLIELLAVIVILAIISAIAIPAVGNILSKTKENAHTANALLVINAARYYVIDQNSNISTTTLSPTVVELKELVSNGYLETVPVDPEASSKGATYSDTASKVSMVKNSSNVITYTVTLANSDGSKKYIDAKTEASLQQKSN